MGRGRESLVSTVHACAQFPRNLGKSEIYPYNHDVIMYTATSSAHFLTNGESLLIVRSPAPSNSLQWLGTSDMSLKKYM